MNIVIKAQLASQADADMFNALSKYTFDRLGVMDASQEGKDITITIDGPDELLEELKDYLVERQLGVI